MESLGTGAERGRRGRKRGRGRKRQEGAFPLPAPVPSDSIAGPRPLSLLPGLYRCSPAFIAAPRPLSLLPGSLKPPFSSLKPLYL